MMTAMLMLWFIPNALCIWPPPYEIKLDQGETFVISELASGDELYDDGDEMIKNEPLSDDEDKYSRIHQMAIRYNKRKAGEGKLVPNMKKIKERNFDLEDPTVWQGGFVDENGEFIQPDNENVYYLNEMAKSLIERKIDQKRGELITLANQSDEEKMEHYDYNGFKAEYGQEVKKAALSNDTLNFTDVKEDENLKDALDAIVETEVKNCTVEESRGIGISAIKCVLRDFKRTKSSKGALQLLEKFLKISLIWLSVYLIIAIPCWCSRGWCCCCCRCKCCKPRERIEEVKRFFAKNPPGIYHTSDDQTLEYEPTPYEIYTQKRLEKSLFHL